MEEITKILVVLDEDHFDARTIEYLLDYQEDFSTVYVKNLKVTASSFDLTLHPSSMGEKLNKNFITYGTGKNLDIDLSYTTREFLKNKIISYLGHRDKTS